MVAGARSSFIGTMLGSSFVSGSFAISYSSPVVANVGDTAALAVTASGGTAPITYAVQSGALPDGLSLDTGTGAITGDYTADGAFSATIRATDAAARTADASISWVVSLVALGFFTNAGYCANEWV